MFENNYKLRISGKDCRMFIKELIKSKVNFKNIEFKDKDIYAIVDEINYKRIKSIKTSYKIKVIKLYGLIRINDILKRYRLFFISLFFGLITLLLLSNLILKVEVINNKKEIRDLIYEELNKYNINKYKFAVSFKKQREITKKIIENNKDKLQWLEIERVGTKYIVRVEERVLKDEKETSNNRHIVAGKDGIIMKITAEKGEIVKKVNNYVKKGDIIISGYIKKNDEIVEVTKATGQVYAEIWYLVEVGLPINYHEEKYTGKKKTVFSLTILGKDFNIFDFNKYKYKKREEIKSIKDKIGIIEIGIYKEKELNIIDESYNLKTASTKIEKIAQEKIESLIKGKGEIISQKKLKIKENNSTIEMKVFFKVCEDITDTMEIKEETIQ